MKIKSVSIEHARTASCVLAALLTLSVSLPVSAQRPGTGQLPATRRRSTSASS